MKQTVLICIGAFLLILGGVYFSMSVTATNKEAKLRNAIEGKIKVNKSAYTKMFEVLVNEAGVSRKYAKDFKEIYVPLVEGRYKNGNGSMMQWVQEHNPKFETKLYEKLMISIEAQREMFHTNQTELIDLSREHNDLLTMFPTKWFLSDKAKIEIPVVINNAAEKAFETGKEESMNLMGDDEPAKDTIK